MQEIMQFAFRHQILSASWIILIAAAFSSILQEITSKIKIVTCSEAIHLINREKAVVIDLRQRDDFYKGHIVGAINLLLTEITSDNIFEKLEKHKTKPIVIVNDTGILTRKPANELVKAGFENVYILKEGISGWNNENLPLVHGK